MDELKTYGELKKVIKSVATKQKLGALGGVGKDQIIGTAVDILGKIVPGVSAAKTTFDVVKALISKPDTKKTNTWLDKLDIDDEMSAIVDDTVENGFMQAMAKSIESESDDTPLEDDFNMNAKMVDYLEKEYGGRTVTGIKENKMKDRFQKLAGIKEEMPTIQGQIKQELFKKLGVVDFDPAKFSTTINLVKQGKPLNPAANKVLADMMVAMIKTEDNNLLNQIFQNLKQFKTK